MAHVERFAPSPTGPLHLGHAYSALLAWDRAVENGGEFLLRIEDIDQSRCRPEWEVQIYQDLEWLGIWWPKPVLRQSERLQVYQREIEKLWQQHALFFCSCSRKDILDAPQEGAPIWGPDGVVYPGTCGANIAQPGDMDIPKNTALRLNMSFASSFGYLKDGEDRFSFIETGCSPDGQTGLIEFSADEAIETI
ncbi:MAG TPA: tRNA glutamyl-Q(34) synthetase GluQRS, partial [Rhodobacteraceae bacterium]|nr:tRNA glutamyl-Q(34) synthetase GluQRS [Paracoccaceae bacterium]